jgi:hypothetical protein
MQIFHLKGEKNFAWSEFNSLMIGRKLHRSQNRDKKISALLSFSRLFFYTLKTIEFSSCFYRCVIEGSLNGEWVPRCIGGKYRLSQRGIKYMGLPPLRFFHLFARRNNFSLPLFLSLSREQPHSIIQWLISYFHMFVWCDYWDSLHTKHQHSRAACVEIVRG